MKVKQPDAEILEYIKENYRYRDGEIDGNMYNNVGEFSNRPDGKVIRRIRIKGKNYKVHHIVWFLCYGFWPNYEIDHIDRDTLNNKVENLREVTKSEQLANRSNTSAYRGISIELRKDKPRSKPWRVRNQSKGINLGSFESAEEAMRAIDAWIESGGKWWI